MKGDYINKKVKELEKENAWLRQQLEFSDNIIRFLQMMCLSYYDLDVFDRYYSLNSSHSRGENEGAKLK